jgi:hypothetical protein
MSTRTLWLSFVDDDKPEGQRLLGVAIIEVTDAMVTAARADVAERFPDAPEGGEVVAAAMIEAWRLGCNPGGRMSSVELEPDQAVGAPRGVLMSPSELEARGLV